MEANTNTTTTTPQTDYFFGALHAHCKRVRECNVCMVMHMEWMHDAM